MSKSKQPESKAPIRHTVRPGVSSPIFLQTVSGATCHLRRVDDVDPTRGLKLFADDEEIICFHVRPSVEAEVIAKFVIECEADAKISHYPLELERFRIAWRSIQFDIRRLECSTYGLRRPTWLHNQRFGSGLMAMARMIWFRQALNKITSFIIFLDNICRSRITMHGRNFYPNNLTSRSSPTYRLIPGD